MIKLQFKSLLRQPMKVINAVFLVFVQVISENGKEMDDFILQLDVFFFSY